MLNIFDKVLLRCMKMMSYFISAKTGLSFHLSLEICEYEIKHYNLNITILDFAPVSTFMRMSHFTDSSC